MKLVFAIRDSAMDQFSVPMFFVSKGEALRSVGQVVNRAQEGNLYNSHPGDYELYYLGTFDEDKGVFVSNAPASVVRLKELVLKSEVGRAS